MCIFRITKFRLELVQINKSPALRNTPDAMNCDIDIVLLPAMIRIALHWLQRLLVGLGRRAMQRTGCGARR